MLFTYERVSTDDQAADGATSIAEQQRKNNALATMRGVASGDIADFVDAGVSGSISLCERPAGKEMLAAVRKGDVIVAAKLDRLFRSALDALNTVKVLQEQGVEIILIDLGMEPVTASGSSKLFFSLLAVFADFERDRIRERMDDGRKAKRARFGFMGGHAPYGYHVEGSGRTAQLVIDDIEQEIIKIVKEMMPQHKKPRRIMRYLASKGYRPRNGKRWQSIQVQRIMELCRVQ